MRRNCHDLYRLRAEAAAGRRILPLLRRRRALTEPAEPAPSCEGSAPEETPEKPPCVPEAICPPADAQAAARAAQNTGETPPQSAQPEVQGGMCVREYFLCLVLFCIPVLGLIPMVAWAFSGHVCKEKRRLSRAALCLAGVVLAAVLLALMLAVVLLQTGAVPVQSMV